MTDATLISFRGYRAHRAAKRLQSLPYRLRTAERAQPALSAIIAYAWEDRPGDRPAEPAQVAARLAEFVPPAGPGLNGTDLVRWLYQNLVPEAWESPALLQGFMGDCIRQG